MSIVSTAILLVLIMNPLGNMPVFLSTLKKIDSIKHTKIILRETFFAYLTLVAFMLFGKFFLRSVHISEQALGVAGGIILFLVALRMIFPEKKDEQENNSYYEPFFVPLAIPLTAGPGALTTVLLLSTQQPNKKFLWFIAITLAAITVSLILLSGRLVSKFLGENGLTALERLSGMMLTAMAVQMFLEGIHSYFKLG